MCALTKSLGITTHTGSAGAPQTRTLRPETTWTPIHQLDPARERERKTTTHLVIASGETHVCQPSEWETQRSGFQCSRVLVRSGLSRASCSVVDKSGPLRVVRTLSRRCIFGGNTDSRDPHTLHKASQTLPACRDSIFDIILFFEPECALVRRLEHYSVGDTCADVLRCLLFAPPSSRQGKCDCTKHLPRKQIGTVLMGRREAGRAIILPRLPHWTRSRRLRKDTNG